MNFNLLLNFLRHHKLGAFGGHRVLGNTAWKRLCSVDVQRALYREILQSKARRRLVLSALGDVLEIIADLEPVLFKGLAAGLLYPDPSLRDPGDIDLLLPAERFDTASERFSSAGWILQETVHRRCRPEVAERYGFALVFRHPRSPVTVDLHRAPVDRTEPFWLDPDDIYRERLRVDLGDGLEVCVPSNEDHLALLALHSVRHGFFRLAWLLDIHLACDSWMDGFSSPVFCHRLREWKILRAVRVGLELARLLFHTSRLPLDELPLDRATKRAVLRRSFRAIAVGRLVEGSGWRRVSAMVDLLDDWKIGASYLLKTAFPSRSLYMTVSEGVPSRVGYLKKRFAVAVSMTRS